MDDDLIHRIRRQRSAEDRWRRNRRYYNEANDIQDRVATAMHAGAIAARSRISDDMRFLEGLLRDLSRLRELDYVRVHIPEPSTAPPPVRTLYEMTVEGDVGDCAICQEEFKVGDIMVPLPCNDIHPHIFHKDCISPWVRSHDTCPVCRGKI